MIFKNLFRRRGRTLLAVLGISIGVAAIIGLGAMANGFEAGYQSLLSGSKADLILSQPDSFDISYSSVDEAIGVELEAMPEIAAFSGMLEGFVQAEDIPFFFVFGYPDDSFLLQRYQIISGAGLDSREAAQSHGRPILLGASAAETLKKELGDSLRLGESVYRITGIYETGEAFEDSGGILRLKDAQELLGKPRQVSLFYIQLKSPELRDRLAKRAERIWKDLSLSGTDDYADRQLMGDVMRGYGWAIAGLAILIGGIGMMNSQLMAILERTREIGVLRAVGWSRRRVLMMILGESLIVCLVGGVLGLGLGLLALQTLTHEAGFFGAAGSSLSPNLLIEAFVVVLTLGLVGGLYPAFRAARLEPVEALRYEGGSGGKAHRLPFGGMAVQSLRQRTGRTLLTLGAIGLTVGSIIALEGVIRGASDSLTDILGSDMEIMIRQADIADTSLSAIDERTGEKIAAMPGVQSISGLIFTAVTLPDAGGFFMLFGYAPNEFAIRRFNIVDGKRLTSNHQIMLGRMMASSLKKDVGDTMELSGARFRVVGIYESGTGWEELGGVTSLRDAQMMAGRPRKVTMYGVKLQESGEASVILEKINKQFPEAHAALAGEFVEQMPDMQTADGLLSGISILAILVGGVGVMNTMLMAVLERTREIGVLRALGWRRSAILGMILQESTLLGLLGGGVGILFSFSLVYLMMQAPMVGDSFTPFWKWDIFARAILIALFLGMGGGLYPAFRATRLQPVEALRYE